MKISKEISNMKALFKNVYFIAIIFAVIKLLIHLLTNTNYDLHRDTFLYYSISQHLDWGYVSVPPLIAFITRFSLFLFGYSAFGLNVFPALVGSIEIIMLALVVVELGGGRKAIFLACLAFLVSPAYLRSNTLLQPVSFDHFFWFLSAYFILKLLKTEQPKFWIYIFIVWAIGFLNKYLIAVYAVSFILGLLMVKERKVLFSKYFVWGALLGSIIIGPNLFWQFSKNWPVLRHLSELTAYQLVNVSLVGFTFDQFLMNFPGVLVWIAGLFVFIIRPSERKYLTFSITSVLTILLLLLVHGKSYYTLGLYPFLLAAGGYAFEKYQPGWYLKFVVVFAIVFALPMLPISLPIFSLKKVESYTEKFAGSINTWEDGKIHKIPQDYADMTGWKELAKLVIKTYQSLPDSEKTRCSIYAENYGQAGAVKFYGRPFKIPEPISFNDNFLLWAPDSFKRKNLIYINDTIGDIKYLYKSCVLKGKINNQYFRENGLMVFYCTQPVDSFKFFYQKKVAHLKSIYRRTTALTSSH